MLRDGRILILCGRDEPAQLFDPATGDPLRVPENSDGTPELAAFQSHDVAFRGQVVAAQGAGLDGAVGGTAVVVQQRAGDGRPPGARAPRRGRGEQEVGAVSTG